MIDRNQLKQSAGVLKYHLKDQAKSIGASLKAPRRGDSGYDIHASQAVTLFAGEQRLIPTGLQVEIPYGYVGIIKDRSSMANKRIYTHAGVVDPNYRGEVMVMLANGRDSNYHIEAGDRIAQLIIVKCESELTPIEVLPDDFSDSVRGEGAFGSTGK